MSRTVYKYTVEVLKKVSFNPKLFKRELEKASKKLLPHEYTELMIWAKNFKFQKREHFYHIRIFYQERNKESNLRKSRQLYT